MSTIGIIWIAAIVVFIILEAVTYQIVSIWFVFGSIGAMIAYLLGTDFYVQLIVFIAVSAILLSILRPLSIKLIKKQDFKTNSDSLIGKNVLITQEVSNIKGTGQGKINGMSWTVRGEGDEVIHAGEIARIKKIEGVKLIAEKIG
ncbi:MAG: NfeD family protein [Clostridiales bacterium]|nr:NfeD family protein [Clostridiales bacterium]